jgi:uncharacterized protein YgbK (DUF1537 family)
MTSLPAIRDVAPAPSPWYGYYGDDFTGATDTLAHLARAGLRAILFMAMPTAEQLTAAGPLDAVGMAGTARSMAPQALEAELSEVGAGFAALGVRVLHYKVCSTFDSSPRSGSIGVAINVLRRSFSNPLVAIVGGQPDLRRYCVFGNLFAAAGAASTPYRIDRHPTMSCHPVTPMGEADLRLHLQAQGLPHVALVDCTTYVRPLPERVAVLDALLAQHPDAVLFDALETAHLALIGALIAPHAQRSPMLVVGASSVAQALAATSLALELKTEPRPEPGPEPEVRVELELSTAPETERDSGPKDEPRRVDRRDVPRVPAIAPGPVFILAGSLSPLTAQQIAHASAFEQIELAPEQLCGDAAPAYLEEILIPITAALNAGRHVLAFTRRVGEPQSTDRDDPRTLALACGRLLRHVLDATQLHRVAVAGGDTSSYAMQQLDAWGLSYLSSVCPGVALTRLHSDRPHLDGLEIVLKGGQMGDVDLFERLLGPL